jgi:DNA polymerase III alpha subunit
MLPAPQKIGLLPAAFFIFESLAYACFILAAWFSMRSLMGGAKNGVGPDIARVIFDKIEKFASYGFNKSHAAAYAYLTYTTAYLKANFPKEWLASLMTCDRDDLSKVAKFIREAHAMQIAILPPDINESGMEFTATSKGIRFCDDPH